MSLAGVLVIDKPGGMTSHDVVMRVRRILGVKKVGHTGTLDPMATGLLPLCIGGATKIARFLEGGEKEYRATIKFGVETDTYDAEGKVVAESDTSGVSEEMVVEALAQFKGKIQQIPPMYSAVKIGGTPLYKLARKGITVEREPKEVEISAIDVEEFTMPLLTMKITCSKGTYIRTLCHDLGSVVGCGAHLVALRRTRSGYYSIQNAITLDADKSEMIESIVPPKGVIAKFHDESVSTIMKRVLKVA
ncbi:MAG: tRNA pseudouridine(55) synthase TruB [Deltaproteobacteria bacterium]|nr:tRNA pseudouridine(55) synthase TruB [Deltaproteobacteria bacterium]